MPISTLQFVSTLAWVITALLLFRSFLRAFFGRHSEGDTWRAALFIAALLFAGFSGRWLLAPAEMGIWKLLYGLSFGLAVYVWLLLWNGRAR